MGDNLFNSSKEVTNEGGVANFSGTIGNFANTVPGEPAIPDNDGTVNLNGSAFKACSNNLPEKTNFWTKVKNVLFYEIKVELTPHQQKIEDDINAFLHQDVTAKSVKNFFFQEITFGKKKNN